MKIVIILAALNLGTVQSSYGHDGCRQIEALARQYAGVTLTSQQQAIKRKLAAWYRRNCMSKASS